MMFPIMLSLIACAASASLCLTDWMPAFAWDTKSMSEPAFSEPRRCAMCHAALDSIRWKPAGSAIIWKKPTALMALNMPQDSPWTGVTRNRLSMQDNGRAIDLPWLTSSQALAFMSTGYRANGSTRAVIPAPVIRSDEMSRYWSSGFGVGFLVLLLKSRIA